MRIAIVFLLLAGCALDTPPRPPADPDVCEPVCEHLRELGCPEGAPTPEGVTCERVCRDVQASRLNVIDGACILEAETCAAAGECS